jgi:hypothetical protein
VRGWSLDTPGDAPASSMPINCSMFDGISIVKCECSEVEILDMLSNAEDTRRRLGKAIAKIMQLTVMEETKHLRASWRRCRPMPNGVPQSLCSAIVTPSNGVSLTAAEDSDMTGCGHTSQSRVTFLNTEDCVPLIDSEPWIPELSPEGFIGFYHHWNYDETRQGLHADDFKAAKGPSLYIACQSYLPTACMDFADMVRDLGDSCISSDIYHSQEAYWLRQACSRNRARLIAAVCHEMKLGFPTRLDYNACKAAGSPISPSMTHYLAMPCTETLHHDIQSIVCKQFRQEEDERKELIRVLNFCSCSAHSACVMAPWDGVWVFHGDAASSSGMTTFFPSITPQLAEHDHLALKHKKSTVLTDGSLSFSSNVLHICEILNIFGKKCKKNNNDGKGRSGSRRKTVKVQSESKQNSLSLLLSLQEYNLGTLDDMHLVLPSDAESMKRALLSSTQDSDGNTYDPDITAAYKRSISKMASLVFNALPVGGHASSLDPKNKKKTFLSFNEPVMQAMEQHGWKRSRGYTVLIPLACGLYEHWKAFSDEEEAKRLAQ